MGNNNLEPSFITACPYCYAKNPKSPTHFLEYDPNKLGVVICDIHGEMPITNKLRNGPRFYFSHYEEP